MSRIFVVIAVVALVALLALALYGCFENEKPVDPVVPEETTPGPAPMEYDNEETLPDTGNPLGL